MITKKEFEKAKQQLIDCQKLIDDYKNQEAKIWRKKRKEAEGNCIDHEYRYTNAKWQSQSQKTTNMKQKTAMLFTIILLFYVCMWGIPPFDKELDSRLGELLRSNVCENGSCGWVAYCISGYLDRGGISNEIVTLNGFGYETIHVVVRVGECYIDKHGFSSKYHPMLLLEKKIISRGKLYQMLNDFPLWNINFKLKDTSIIKKIILHE